jgi:hypothetical protein
VGWRLSQQAFGRRGYLLSTARNRKSRVTASSKGTLEIIASPPPPLCTSAKLLLLHPPFCTQISIQGLHQGIYEDRNGIKDYFKFVYSKIVFPRDL